jgi:hypothetical protein
MTGAAALPQEVLTLLARSLPSMVHIELLLLIFRTEPQQWTVEDAAAEVRTSPALAAAAFADLDTARLAVPVPGTEEGSYTLAPLDSPSRAACASLQDVYDRRPVTLVKALYKRPQSSVQAFADAFRVRPEER